MGFFLNQNKKLKIMTWHTVPIINFIKLASRSIKGIKLESPNRG